jgi:hypothetical protein
MLRTPTLAALTLAVAMSPGSAEGHNPQDAKREQGIRAEVKGTLHFENGRGYFISVRAEKAGRETRVWLMAAEDKALARQLAGLDGMEVTARGTLAQLPQDVHANVPPLGLYLPHGFTIERAVGK